MVRRAVFCVRVEPFGSLLRQTLQDRKRKPLFRNVIDRSGCVVTATQGAPSRVVAMNSALVSDAAGALRQIAQTLTTAVRDLDGDISGLWASWGGPAAGAFAAGWDQARTGAVEVLGSLEEMADLLGVQSAEFDQVDEELAATFTAVPSAPQPSSLRLFG